MTQALFYMPEDRSKSIIASHNFYLEQATKRLLSQFDDIETEADRFGEAKLKEYAAHYNPEADNGADLQEAAYEEMCDHYHMLGEMRDRTRLSVVAGTRAMISQYVLIEIKAPSASLLKAQEYRSGCWTAHADLSGAVTQIQKTAFDFTSNQYHKIQAKDREGRITGEEIFRIQPKSYLVIGNLAELQGNDDKFACFHLYRTSLTSPEILTYDELYERAKCIVETISHQKVAS